MSRRAQLNFHRVPEHVSDDEDGAPSTSGPAPVLQPRAAKHTRLNLGVSTTSRSNTRSSYHEALPSPAKAPPLQQVWDYVDAEAQQEDASAPVDVAYLHHLGTVDVEPNPRAYTQAVSSSITYYNKS